MRASAKTKRRRHDIQKAWTFIHATGMRAYVSGYDEAKRQVIVTPRNEPYDTERAMADVKAFAARLGTVAA